MNIRLELPPVRSVWGFGERYDLTDHIAVKIVNRVEEKFTHQGEKTYLPVPIAVSSRFAVRVDTDSVFSFTFFNEGGHTVMELNGDGLSADDVKTAYGKPRDTVAQLTGEVCSVPDWVFAPWSSANRWTSDEDVEKFISDAERYGFSFSTLVLEAWSDEATFYTFKKEFRDPAALCRRLMEKGIHLILWQCPVLKVEDGFHNEQLEKDICHAKENNLLVKNGDGSFYTIPEGHWFQHSYVPDFTNPRTRIWWMKKRQSLIDAGISGFKTDGGEFILSDDTVFFNGMSGRQMRNRYPDEYVSAYLEYMNDGMITFSRSGYRNAGGNSCFWAGDQMSSFDELEPVLRAGLNAAVSGVFWWGFDTAGFAGPMPSAELYLRSYMLSVFVPIMQWHSEPVGGQFREFMKSGDEINDRSPWNVAEYRNCPELVDICRRYSDMRMRLQDYIISEAHYSRENREPLMRPMFYMYPDDEDMQCVYDEFLFGRSLLIAPILHEGVKERTVILPEGEWYDVQHGEIIKGRLSVSRVYELDEIGIFISLPEGRDLINMFGK